MDHSFLKSQHPVVEELLTNKYFGDTLLVCANGHLTDNKLAVGLLFPSLLTSDIFALPIENVLLVPDYTMEEIGREFEKLILGGSRPPQPNSNPTPICSASQTEPIHHQPNIPNVHLTNQLTNHPTSYLTVQQARHLSDGSVLHSSNQSIVLPAPYQSQQKLPESNAYIHDMNHSTMSSNNHPDIPLTNQSIILSTLDSASNHTNHPIRSISNPQLIHPTNLQPTTFQQIIHPSSQQPIISSHLPTINSSLPVDNNSHFTSSTMDLTPVLNSNLCQQVSTQMNSGLQMINSMSNVESTYTQLSSLSSSGSGGNTDYLNSNTVFVSSDRLGIDESQQMYRYEVDYNSRQSEQDEEQMYDGDIQNEENLVIDTNQEQELDCEQDKYQEEKFEKQELEKEEEIPSQFYIPDQQQQQQQEQLQLDSSNFEVTLVNGYSENCENIHISNNSEHSIRVYIETNHNQASPEPPELERMVPCDDKRKKRVSFLEGQTQDRQVTKSRNRIQKPGSQNLEPRPRPARVGKPKTKLRIEEYEDEDVDMIENLTDRENVGEVWPEEPAIIEDRKPGRPRVKPSPLNQPASDGITRFKLKSAQHVEKETFKCVQCGKVLSCQGSLNRHLLVHSDGKPFKCRHCPKSFRERSKRSVHERIHTGSKPYRCKVCGRGFKTSTQRSIHLKMHTKEKPFSCETCSKKFAQKNAMIKHAKKIHGPGSQEGNLIS